MTSTYNINSYEIKTVKYYAVSEIIYTIVYPYHIIRQHIYKDHEGLMFSEFNFFLAGYHLISKYLNPLMNSKLNL